MTPSDDGEENCTIVAIDTTIFRMGFRQRHNYVVNGTVLQTCRRFLLPEIFFDMEDLIILDGRDFLTLRPTVMHALRLQAQVYVQLCYKCHCHCCIVGHSTSCSGHIQVCRCLQQGTVFQLRRPREQLRLLAAVASEGSMTLRKIRTERRCEMATTPTLTLILTLMIRLVYFYVSWLLFLLL